MSHSRQTRAIEILEQLVAFDSISRNSNLPILEWIEGYLDSHSVPHQRIDFEPGKANLLATIGPADASGLVLSGHTDVVPVDGQDWTSDPFTLTHRDGRLYGRGSADMKGFIAVCLALVPDMLAANLKKPIHFALSCDEEIGCKGVVPLIDVLSQFDPLPFGAIVGEPTSMEVITRQKGALTYLTKVTGVPTHSCDPRLGVNAITAAAKLIGELDDIAEQMIAEADKANGFDPPWSTLNVGVISGGTQKNIVPSHCEFKWECRPLPDLDVETTFAPFFAFQEELSAKLSAPHETARIETKLVRRVAGLKSAPGNTVEVLAKRAAQKNRTGTASFASEAGVFEEGGIPTVLCGPGSIDQAHKADEYLDMAQVTQCLEFVEKLIQDLA